MSCCHDDDEPEETGVLEYKVLEAQRADFLEEKLNELAEDGWVIEGQPVVRGTAVLVILARVREEGDGDGGDDAQPPTDDEGDKDQERGRYLQ